MPWASQNVSVTLVTIWFLLFWNAGSNTAEHKHREKRVAILGTTEIPAASVDLSQFNFTDLVNGMLRKAVKGAKNIFSFLSVTSYSSMAFHKVSILIYNISNLKYVDYQKFPMRYCYCLNNRTNDLADYTVLLLDIVGNTTSSLKELFKSTSIVSVSQSNESDCIYFCVMTGRTGRNLTDLWDLTQKPPIINFTFPKNESSDMDIESILPNLIMSSEDTQIILDIPKELWTLKTVTGTRPDPNRDTLENVSFSTKPMWSSSSPMKSPSTTFTTTSARPFEKFMKGIEVLSSSVGPSTQAQVSEGQSLRLTMFPFIHSSSSSKQIDIVPSKLPHSMGSLLPQKQEQPSEKLSLFQHNALNEHSISFSEDKSQEGSLLKLPTWTTIATLEMLERPYSVVPLWTDNSFKGEKLATSTQSTIGLPYSSPRETNNLPRESTMNNKSTSSGGHTVAPYLVTIKAPLKQEISSAKGPLVEDNGMVGKENVSPDRPKTTLNNGHEISSITPTSLGITGASQPQIKPAMIDGHKMSAYGYTQSKSTNAQESGLSPVSPELPDLPLPNVNNFTFNGVFKNVESVTSFLDCLGSHFTWLQNIFTNFPALLNFVSKLKCVTGLCPKDLEDYGCTCRYEMEGLPVDEVDSCCFQHRKCYEEALELDCTWDPTRITADVSCLSKNLTCETGDACEKVLCACDKAAIECLVNLQVNSSMKGMDITFCESLVTEATVQKNEMAGDAKAQQNRSVESISSPVEEGEQADLQNDVTPYPATEETPGLTENAHLLLSASASGPPDIYSTESSAAGVSTGVIGGFLSSFSTVASESSSRKVNMTPTRTGFKMADESTIHLAGFPLSMVTESGIHESLERVCDRYYFNQLKEDGNVKAELPLLGEMLFCLTGRCPEEFESYGCYCGQEGKGNPVDILDSCCFSHHCCTEHLKKLGCKSDRNVRSEVLCMDNKPTCIGWGICDKLLCACDKAAAECMASAPFNQTMRTLRRDQCPDVPVVCRNGDVGDTPDRAIVGQSDSSSSEESSEEHSPMRDIVRAGPNPGPSAPHARRPRSPVSEE